jgi:hypothetical protein
VKRSEMKNFWKRNKLKIYALLILLWSEAKNSKRKEAKKIIISRERVKRMRNGSRFASFCFEANNFFAKQAHPTGGWYHS